MRIEFPASSNDTKVEWFHDIKFKSKGRKQHEQLSGIACGFSHVNFLLFSVVSFFLPDISLLFYYVSLFILISLWYVYYVCTLQLCWFPGFHQATAGSLLSPRLLLRRFFSVYNLIQLRVWCQFCFSTLFRSYTRPCLERFRVKFRRSRDGRPLTNENGPAVSFNFSLKQRLMAQQSLFLIHFQRQTFN